MKSRIKLYRIIVLIIIPILFAACIKINQFDVILTESEVTLSEDGGSVDVEFSLPDGARRQDIEVAFRIDGTAEEGKDYATIEERFIIIPSGLPSVSFSIDLIDNIERDGVLTIEIFIVLVIQNGNNIFQGSRFQSMIITVIDDDCSVYIKGTWEFVAEYYMYAGGDTIVVGQDGKRLIEGANPVFTGEVTIEDPEGRRNYFVNDMMMGMFRELDIETPSPIIDECGTLSGPNDGSVVLMGTLPARMSGKIESDDHIILDFEYSDHENTGGGGGHAELTRK